MKSKFVLYHLGPLISISIILLSCVKKYSTVAEEQSGFNNKSLVQVFVATVNANRNFLFVDGIPVNGASLTSGSFFPGTGTYAFTVNGGLRNFQLRDTLNTSTQVPLVFAENLQAGKQYTVFAYDTITSPKQVTVLTNIVVPVDTTARLRVANFIHNSFAVPGVDVFSKRRNANVFTNVGRTEVTDFIPYASMSNSPAYFSGSNDTLLIRETGTLNQLAVLNGFNPTQKRSYTLVYRGSHRGTKAATIFANY